MKKSLQELVTPDNNESPDNSFGAFTNVESGQAKIDLDKLRELRAELKSRVASEKRYSLISQGLGDPKTLYVRF